MKLALSVRVAEAFEDKRRATVSLDDLARIATDNGYAGAVHARVAARHPYAAGRRPPGTQDP